MTGLANVLGLGTENLAIWLLALSMVQVAMLVAIVVLWRRTTAHFKHWTALVRDLEGVGAGDLLRAHLEALAEHDARLHKTEARLEALEAKSARSVRRVGLVKYDAFEDVGGNQSFALAMVDDEGNGMLLTGLVGRTESRVFAKKLVSGRAEVSTTAEEDAAIAAAKKWD